VIRHGAQANSDRSGSERSVGAHIYTRRVDEIAMDRHVRELRQEVTHRVVRSLLLTATLGALVTQGLLVSVNGGIGNIREVDEMVRHVPLALLAGQGIALIRLALAFSTNPLTSSYLRSYTVSDPAYAEGPVPGQPHHISGEVIAADLRPTVTVSRGVGPTAAVFDLYQSADSLVTCAIGRSTGSISLATAVSDGRVASTTALFVPPNEHLISNIVTNAGVGALLESHRSLFGLLIKQEIRPVAAAPSIWIAAASCEHASYRDLGAHMGVFINVTGLPTFGRLMAQIDPVHVLELALTTHGSPKARRGSTSLNGTVAPAKAVLGG